MTMKELKLTKLKDLRHRWIIPVSMATAALLASSPPASADDFPDNHHDGLADSSVHTYCLQSWDTANDENVVHYAMQNVLDNTTDMTDSFSSTCTTSTDAVFRDVNLSGNTRGRYQCQTYTGDDCNYSIIQLDFAQIDIGSWDWQDRRKTSVHEVGHSVGANHDSTSAMISGAIPNANLQYRRFSTHDISHINANY